MAICFGPDCFVLVLSETVLVLSETVLVLVHSR